MSFEKTVRTQKNNLLIALAATMVYLLVVGVVFDHYYYINDDLLIRDIFSGRFSGTPDAHVYNVIYPFAWLLMMCYRLIPTVDFWAVCMVGLLYVCLFLVQYRVLNLVKGHWLWAVVPVYLVFTATSLFGICQFTFTCTGSLCAMTALFWFVTGKRPTAHFTQDLPALVLLLLSFCIRKDTFFMMLPFFALWGLYLLLTTPERKSMLHSLLKPMAALAVCCGLLFGTHLLAFSNDAWQDFLVFRDLRKSVHDYGGYPVYEQHPDYYAELGLSSQEHTAVSVPGAGGGNTVLDFSQDICTILGQTGQYNQNLRAEQSAADRMTAGLRQAYVLHSVMTMLQWYDLLSIGLFVLLAAVLWLQKRWLALAALVAGYAGLGLEVLYLLWCGRMTFQVMSMLVVITVVWSVGIGCAVLPHEPLPECGRLYRAAFAAFAVLSVVCALGSVTVTASKQAVYAQRSSDTDAIYEYCKSHGDNAYFQPAMSIAVHSDCLEDPFDSRFNNLVILGGWNATSPAYQQSVAAMGLADCSIEQAVLERDNVFVISPEANMNGLLSYFQWKYGMQFRYDIVDALPLETPVYVYDLTVLPE